MDQLIELLKQIQELAGVGIEALSAAGKAGGKPAAGGDAPAPQGGDKPPAGPPQQDQQR